MKQIDGDQVPDVFDAYKLMHWNLHEETSKFKAYDMVQWAKYIDHWSTTKGHRYTTTYARGEILMVDLGAMNFGYEFSYSHPAVVLYSTEDMLYVVPGSSKKFGLGKRGIIDAMNALDGFDKDTGLLLYNMRWIHKNRVKHSTGKQTSQRVLKNIEDFILRLNHEYHEEVKRRAQSNKRLRTNVHLLHQEAHRLQQIIHEKEQVIEHKEQMILKHERRLEKYRNHYDKMDGILELLKKQHLSSEIQELIGSLALEKPADGSK